MGITYITARHNEEERLGMTILRANGDSSWWTEVPPMFETWELWQWIVASVLLLLAWVAVSVGWAMFMLGRSWTVIVGPILAVLGAVGVCWATTRLMRHMPEQSGSLLLALGLFVFAMVTWYGVGRMTQEAAWPIPAALLGGTVIAMGIDAFNRHLASIPAAPIILVLGVLVVGALALSPATRR